MTILDLNFNFPTDKTRHLKTWEHLWKWVEKYILAEGNITLFGPNHRLTPCAEFTNGVLLDSLYIPSCPPDWPIHIWGSETVCSPACIWTLIFPSSLHLWNSRCVLYKHALIVLFSETIWISHKDLTQIRWKMQFWRSPSSLSSIHLGNFRIAGQANPPSNY